MLSSEMKLALMINIDDKSLEGSKEEILNRSLEVLANLYDQYGLDYDIGYNPQLITNGEIS